MRPTSNDPRLLTLKRLTRVAASEDSDFAYALNQLVMKATTDDLDRFSAISTPYVLAAITTIAISVESLPWRCRSLRDESVPWKGFTDRKLATLMGSTAIDWCHHGWALWMKRSEGPLILPAGVATPERSKDGKDVWALGSGKQVPRQLTVEFPGIVPDPTKQRELTECHAWVSPGRIAAGVAQIGEGVTGDLRDWFRAGAQRLTILSTPEAMEGDEKDTIREAWSRALARSRRVFTREPPILSHGLKPEIVGDTITNKRPTELNDLTRKLITLLYRIPEAWFTDSANFATADEHDYRMWSTCVMPCALHQADAANVWFERLGCVAHIAILEAEWYQRHQWAELDAVSKLVDLARSLESEGRIDRAQANEMIAQALSAGRFGEGVAYDSERRPLMIDTPPPPPPPPQAPTEEPSPAEPPAEPPTPPTRMSRPHAMASEFAAFRRALLRDENAAARWRAEIVPPSLLAMSLDLHRRCQPAMPGAENDGWAWLRRATQADALPADVERFEAMLEQRIGRALSEAEKNVTAALLAGEAAGPAIDAMGEVIRKDIIVVMGQYIQEAVLAAAVESGVGFDPALVNERAMQWLREQAYARSRYWTEATHKAVSSAMEAWARTPGATLETGVQAVLSKADLKAVIGPAFDERRAHLIAVTELTDSVMQASRMFADDMAGLGIEIELVWVTVGDEKTCPICGGLDGVVSKDGQTFIHRTTGVVYTVGPAHPHCRCYIVSRVKRLKKAA